MNNFSKTIFQGIIITALLFVFSSGCKKDEDETRVIHETGTVTDIDGNIYKTVKIGNQWWMAENLKVKRYRDSTLVRLIEVDSVWSGDTIGGYCPFGNDTSGNINHQVYGYLYNWYALNNSSGIAPAGWHVPTDEEWKALERELGMNASEADNSGWRGTDEGDKLKIEAPQGWTQYADVWGTNGSGFTARACACRLFDGRQADDGLFKTGFWWSATTYASTNNESWYRYLDYKKAAVFRSTCSKNYGFSIRCVKN